MREAPFLRKILQMGKENLEKENAEQAKLLMEKIKLEEEEKKRIKNEKRLERRKKREDEIKLRDEKEDERKKLEKLQTGFGSLFFFFYFK
jgi:uncharacterized membrane-anchored protein